MPSTSIVEDDHTLGGNLLGRPKWTSARVCKPIPEWRCSWLYYAVNSSMNSLASWTESNRSGKLGPYFTVLSNASEYGLSFDTRGRERERVT